MQKQIREDQKRKDEELALRRKAGLNWRVKWLKGRINKEAKNVETVSR